MDAMNFAFVRASSLKYLHPFRANVREAYDQFSTFFLLCASQLSEWGLPDQFSTLALKLLREFPHVLCDLVRMSWLI